MCCRKNVFVLLFWMALDWDISQVRGSEDAMLLCASVNTGFSSSLKTLPPSPRIQLWRHILLGLLNASMNLKQGLPGTCCPQTVSTQYWHTTWHHKACFQFSSMQLTLNCRRHIWGIWDENREEKLGVWKLCADSSANRTACTIASVLFSAFVLFRF